MEYLNTPHRRYQVFQSRALLFLVLPDSGISGFEWEGEMLLAQEFKTLEGAQKRARFETAHCGNKFVYAVVRCWRGQRDFGEFDRERKYTWRLERTVKALSRAWVG